MPTTHEWPYELTAEDGRKIQRDFTYHPPQPGQPERYGALREKAKELATLICMTVPPSPERDFALQLLKMSNMTANAAIACHEVPA